MSIKPKKCYPLSILVVLVLVACCSLINLAHGWEGASVKITNRLNHDLLETHCRSKDDDLGYKYLNPNDHIQWDFKLNIFGRTLFYCSFWHGQAFKRIDVYNEKLYDTCVVHRPDKSNVCYWEIREDGFYFNHFEDPKYGTPWVKKYDW